MNSEATTTTTAAAETNETTSAAPAAGRFDVRGAAAAVAVAAVAVAAGVGAGNWIWWGPADPLFDAGSLPPSAETVAIWEEVRERASARAEAASAEGYDLASDES